MPRSGKKCSRSRWLRLFAHSLRKRSDEINLVNVLVYDEDANIVALGISREEKEPGFLRIVGLARANQFFTIFEEDLDFPAVPLAFY